jgi:hypothetical protein
LYKDFSYWHKGEKLLHPIFASSDIYQHAYSLLKEIGCVKPVRNLAVSCFYLQKDLNLQLNIFTDLERRKRLTLAADKVNRDWGEFSVYPARMLVAKDYVPDRISFGGVREL